MRDKEGREWIALQINKVRRDGDCVFTRSMYETVLER